MSANLDTLRVIASSQGFAVYDNARRKINVMALDLFIRPGNQPLMHIAMPAGNVDVVGKALFAIADPATGKPRIVKRIEWADGESTDFPEPERQAEGEQKVPPVFNPNANGQAAPGNALDGSKQGDVRDEATKLTGGP
jgi:hypothetical protein